eukprot:6460459-Amphidinium_carterae.1
MNANPVATIVGRNAEVNMHYNKRGRIAQIVQPLKFTWCTIRQEVAEQPLQSSAVMRLGFHIWCSPQLFAIWVHPPGWNLGPECRGRRPPKIMQLTRAIGIECHRHQTPTFGGFANAHRSLVASWNAYAVQFLVLMLKPGWLALLGISIALKVHLRVLTSGSSFRGRQLRNHKRSH